MHWAVIVDSNGNPILAIDNIEDDQEVECHIPISIGRPYYEVKEVLQDIMDAATKIFGRCKIYIHIADKLQAITLKLTSFQDIEDCAKELAQKENKDWFNLAQEEQNELLNNAAENLAKQKGEQWRIDNKDIIGKIKNIDHWEDWTKQSSFKQYQNAIEKCYVNKTDFSNAVHIAAFNFMGVLSNEFKKNINNKKPKTTEKKNTETKIPNPIDAAKANIDYIKQETAVTKMWQCNSKKAKRFIVIYPSNTPAHQCMVSCMNTLEIDDVEGANKQPPKMEFFDIVFYCSTKSENPLPTTNIYQQASKQQIKKRTKSLIKSNSQQSKEFILSQEKVNVQENIYKTTSYSCPQFPQITINNSNNNFFQTQSIQLQLEKKSEIKNEDKILTEKENSDNSTLMLEIKDTNKKKPSNDEKSVKKIIKHYKNELSSFKDEFWRSKTIEEINHVNEEEIIKLKKK